MADRHRVRQRDRLVGSVLEEHRGGLHLGGSIFGGFTLGAPPWGLHLWGSTLGAPPWGLLLPKDNGGEAERGGREGNKVPGGN